MTLLSCLCRKGQVEVDTVHMRAQVHRFDTMNILDLSRCNCKKAKQYLMYDFLQIREEPPPYSSPDRHNSFDNPLAGSQSSVEGRPSSGNPQFGTALYDFTAGGDDEVR